MVCSFTEILFVVCDECAGIVPVDERTGVVKGKVEELGELAWVRGSQFYEAGYLLSGNV